MIIAEGPCEITVKTFEPFIGRTIRYYDPNSRIPVSDVYVFACNGGVRAEHSLWPGIYLDLRGNKSVTLAKGIRYEA